MAWGLSFGLASRLWSVPQLTQQVKSYPDFVRDLVRQLKRLSPTMRYERMAQRAQADLAPWLDQDGV